MKRRKKEDVFTKKSRMFLVQDLMQLLIKTALNSESMKVYRLYETDKKSTFDISIALRIKKLMHLIM